MYTEHPVQLSVVIIPITEGYTSKYRHLSFQSSQACLPSDRRGLFQERQDTSAEKSMYQRWVTAGVRRALEDTPVVLLVGPRRAGKTTLVRSLEGGDLAYHTLDDPTTRDFAASALVGFVRGLDRAIR